MHDHEEYQGPSDESGIAIVGMSCRFPGATSIHQYWQNLLNGIESIHVETDAGGQIRARAELPDIEDFDYGFFGFSYKEAQLLDPQHRVLLECAWEVLEDASLHAQTGSVGVFCGAGPSSYFINNVHGLRARDSACGLYQSSEALAQFMATDKEFLASRIAYKLNCCGPAVNVQAACATSMYGIQAAIQALLLRECDAALVGAAAVSVPQSIPYYFAPGMPFSADGHCRPFDVEASGTIFGSGAAVVGLKRLGDALADGDQIHAVIRSVATNNDGAHRAGMSAPSVAGQTRVIREALDIAGVSPDQISYVEAHGTATPIGDPIEIKALANAFADRAREHTCYLGSVKGNIGHLGWAAGMAGLIKAILIARYKVIPPTLNFEQYNPQLYIEETPFTVNRQQVVITTPHVIVGVSSFGLGGNNSHLIVETAPAPKVANSSLDHERLCLIPVSARTRDGLQQLCAGYREFLEAQTDDSFPLFVANLLHSRSLFEQRTYVIANHRRGTIDALAKLTFDARPAATTAPRIGLMFSGQGGEHRDMGRELYTHEALFKAELDVFDPVCQAVFGASAAKLLFDPLINGKIEQDITRSQPVTFALQVAMARLFLSSGIGPVALFGHSVGEYAAACIAGVFTAEQGFRMLVQRSRLLDSLGDIGAMVVLGGDHECASRLIERTPGVLSIAALNAVNNTAVSGTLEAVELLLKNADAAGVSATRLKISRPGHSSLLDPLLDRFEAYLDSVELSPPVRPFISTVTGTLAGDEVATSHYWRRQLRETVSFRASVSAALDLGCTHLVEIGPKAMLSGLVLSEAGDRSSVLPMARGGQRDHRQYLTVLGELFQAGADVHLPATQERAPILAGLPNYPFQRVRCWIETSEPAHALAAHTYQTVWQSLTVERMNSHSTAGQKVLFLAPNEAINEAETHYLENTFGQFHCVALNRFMGIGSSSREALEVIAAQDFDGIWSEYVDGVDRVYLDLRQLPNNDVSTAVSTCERVLNLLRSVPDGYDRRPQFCLLFSTVAIRDESMSLNPVANSVVGMLRSVLIEEPDWTVTVLNFIREQSPTGIEDASPIVLLPLTDELVVTVRQAQAFVPRLERAMDSNDARCSFSVDHSYLLIGGAGGIGRQLIESLCADQVRCIHVIGRSALPGEAMQALMMRYPSVRYLGFDLSSDQGRDECAKWLQSAAIGKVTIFNLAVDLHDQLSSEVHVADLQRSFEAKCTSVLTLYELLCDQGRAIECIFNFSSATSILGNGGQSTYGAASAFLDAAHEALFPRVSRVLTVNWGVWGDAGKLRDNHQRMQVLKASGLNSHSSEQGLLVIRQLLAGPSRIAGFMNIDAKVLGDRSRVCARFLEQLVTDDSNKDRTRPASVAARLLECADETPVGSVLETWLVATIDSLVGLEASSRGRYDKIKEFSFKALGFDSLALVQLKNALVTQFDLLWTVKHLSSIQALSELHAALVSHVSQPAWRAAYSERNGSVYMDVQDTAVSLQQMRWISLIGKDYGLRVIPYLIYCRFDAEHCRNALFQVVDEHRLLRTFFPQGQPTVRTTAEVLQDFGALFTDLSSQTAADKTQQIAARVQAMAQALPKPEDNVTWAIHFIDVGEPFFIALIGVQHLEFDGKSLTLLFDRFGECLHHLAEHQPLNRIDHDIGYADYARRQQQYLNQQWAIDAGFFKGLYNAFEGPTVLSAHPGFTSIAACSSSRYSVEVADANRILSELAERHGFSVFNAVLYVYAKTMADVVGCDQLIISAINSGRGLSEFNNVIGPFTSPLPVPITVHHDWLSGISMVARTLEAIQGYPLMHPSMLIGEVSAFSGMAHDTYFSDVGINFLNYRQTAEAPGKVRIEGVEILGPVSEGLLSGANVEDMRRVPGLHLVVEINGDDLRFNFWFHTQRFSTAEVEGWGHRMVQHLKQLLSVARATDEH